MNVSKANGEAFDNWIPQPTFHLGLPKLSFLKNIISKTFGSTKIFGFFFINSITIRGVTHSAEEVIFAQLISFSAGNRSEADYWYISATIRKGNCFSYHDLRCCLQDNFQTWPQTQVKNSLSVLLYSRTFLRFLLIVNHINIIFVKSLNLSVQIVNCRDFFSVTKFI